MSSILEKVQVFLSEANKASVPISSTIINEFGEACKDAFKKQFTEEREDKFRVRMSNIGRPLCQLQMEKKGEKPELPPYNAKMRFIFGDIIEALSVAIMKSAGIKIEEFQKPVTFKSDNAEVNGTYDVKIQDRIWDIKSASPYSFDYKFGDRGGFDAINKDDNFGYVAQGYLYGDADNSDFGGWIAINKSTGEWAVVETPRIDDEHKQKAIKEAKEKVKALNDNAPFKRCYEDTEETFYRKPTGNRTLNSVCSFCPYKKPCWGDEIQYLPQQQSTSSKPKYVWYTKVTNPRKEPDDISTE